MRRVVHTAGEAIYNERRTSILRLLKGGFDRMLSDPRVRTAVRTTGNTEFLVACLDQIIGKYFSSEQEVFLSYLIYKLEEARPKGVHLPEFVQAVKSKISEFDAKYDQNGTLQKLISSSRSVPARPLTAYPVWLSKIAGFHYEANTIHAFLFDIRTLLEEFFRDYSTTLATTREAAVKSLVSAGKQAQVSKKALEEQTWLRSQDRQRMEDELDRLNGELIRAQKLIGENERHRLTFEGQAIRLIQHLDSIQVDSVSDSTVSLTLTEAKKEGQVLRKAVSEGNPDL
jgi:hypothetical protein